MADLTAPADEISILRQKADSAQLSGLVRDRVATQVDRLARLTGSDYTMEADRTSRWIDWIISLPWQARAPDHLDLTTAKEILDKHHHGLEEVKTRLLEYLSVLKLKQSTISNQQLTINLTVSQKTFLRLLAENLKNAPDDHEQIQKIVFDSIKKSGLDPKSAFQAFYLTLTSKPFGPKAGDLVKELGIQKVIDLLKK